MARTTFLAAAAMLLAGCAASRPVVQTAPPAEAEAAAQEPAGKEPDLQLPTADSESRDEFPVGRWCEVRLKDRRTVYAGRIVRAWPEEVVLADGWMRTRSTVPVFGSVPYVSRLFSNTGIGQMQGEKAIRRADIGAIAVHSADETEKILAEEAARRAKPEETASK